MSIKYDKLFALMKEKGLTTYKIRKDNIISQGALTSLRAGKSVTIDTIEKLCKALDCQPGDILEYSPDDITEYNRIQNNKTADYSAVIFMH